METETTNHTATLYRSSKRPDVVTDERDLAKAIAWADELPRAWDIVTVGGATVRQLGGR